MFRFCQSQCEALESSRQFSAEPSFKPWCCFWFCSSFEWMKMRMKISMRTEKHRYCQRNWNGQGNGWGAATAAHVMSIGIGNENGMMGFLLCFPMGPLLGSGREWMGEWGRKVGRIMNDLREKRMIKKMTSRNIGFVRNGIIGFVLWYEFNAGQCHLASSRHTRSANNQPSRQPLCWSPLVTWKPASRLRDSALQ